MKNRYSRNIEALSVTDVENLHKKKVCVIGCGGLGGYIIETLARIGILNITAVDYDVFDETNLNRQLLSTEKTIGCSKAQAAKARVAEINSDASITVISTRLDENNVAEIIANHSLVMDALDNIPARLILAQACKTANIPLIHGSIAGWYGQVAVILPGSDTLNKLYASTAERGIEVRLGNLPFTASLVASLQCAEAVKVLTGKGSVLKNEVLRVDLLDGEFDILMM